MDIKLVAMNKTLVQMNIIIEVFVNVVEKLLDIKKLFKQRLKNVFTNESRILLH